MKPNRGIKGCMQPAGALPFCPPPVPLKEGMMETRSLAHMGSDGEQKTAIQNKLFQSGMLFDGLGTRSCQRRV